MEYKNRLGQSLVANRVVVNKVRKALDKLYSSSSQFFIQAESVEGKVFQNKEQKVDYLILRRGGFYEVFSENHRSNPFSYEKDKLENDYQGKIYSTTIALISSNKDALTEQAKRLDKKMKVYIDQGFGEEELSIMRELVSNTFQIKEESFCSSAYELKTFFNYLESTGSSKSFDLEVLTQNPEHFQQVDKRIPEFGLIVELLQQVTKEHGFNSKNKFDFNDMDNFLWKQGKYTVVKDQNMTFAIDFEGKENFTIYAALHDGGAKKNNTLNKLLTDIKSGNTDLVDNVALKVVNGKTQYSDNVLMYSLDFDLVHTKDVVLGEKLGKIEYPVDILDFDYQLAYHKNYYGYSKDAFLFHALFVLGNGYNYDSKTGRLYSDVTFDKEVVEKIGNIADEPSEKLESMVYLWPKEGMKKLDAKWTAALEYIVDKIKTDKPDLSDACVPHGKTPQQVLKDLQEIINYNKKPKVSPKVN